MPPTFDVTVPVPVPAGTTVTVNVGSGFTVNELLVADVRPVRVAVRE
jgi:hypothetical protein